ncbi:hypothetical protein AAHA92_09216 [Salvia divinorum]|uniref:Uncharacterized protein n=1 Tax=Salvia divinorum TaxID=28513 RepID=A0ABD1HS60_SALDI
MALLALIYPSSSISGDSSDSSSQFLPTNPSRDLASRLRRYAVHCASPSIAQPPLPVNQNQVQVTKEMTRSWSKQISNWSFVGRVQGYNSKST